MLKEELKGKSILKGHLQKEETLCRNYKQNKRGDN